LGLGPAARAGFGVQWRPAAARQGCQGVGILRSLQAQFPDKWLRRNKAEDRWEHAIPDGPQKAAQLKVINRLLKDL